jgi:hypothetical protein
VFWTSGQYTASQEKWVWAGNPTATVSDYTNWGADEPGAFNGRSRIALNHQNQFTATWISIDDTEVERFICESLSA